MALAYIDLAANFITSFGWPILCIMLVYFLFRWVAELR